MKDEMLERVEKVAEELRQIFLELEDIPPGSNDWQERQRKNAVEGISEARQKLGFVHGYINSFLSPQSNSQPDGWWDESSSELRQSRGYSCPSAYWSSDPLCPPSRYSYVVRRWD